MRARAHVLVALAAVFLSAPALHSVPGQSGPSSGRPDFDIRDSRSPAPRRVGAPRDEGPSRRAGIPVNLPTGTRRVLDNPGLSLPVRGTAVAVRARLMAAARGLGLEPDDLAGLSLVRDYRSQSTGLRHLTFAQVLDGHPVFDSAISVHIRQDGTVLRITSNAAPGAARNASPGIDEGQARALAAREAEGTPAGVARLVWLPLDGTVRLAWHTVVGVPGRDDVYDVVIDAGTGDLLVRRNRVRHADGSGRVLQSAAIAGLDPRRPDPTPRGVSGSECPPPPEYTIRSLIAPYRDPATVLGTGGSLDGNNAQVYGGNSSARSAIGSFDGSGWLFDFPFNSAGSAETALFFAVNYAHDFFYDLGFDEAAGNFQADNFGRGGAGGDPLKANARAAGRNNANYVHAPDGTSPTINMFLWDGTGCWAEDVDGNGVPDLDGAYDLDILIHEYHHGVSLRLNTAFTGPEAGAIGEGGGDFFAYSLNGDTALADYVNPAGLRAVNGKDYSDWSCLFGLFCGVHENGQIWANVLWDLRERFRIDGVRGTEHAAIDEVHQLYVDGLKLSPPAPTMLDLRDAMLQADAVRTATGANRCRLWETFAGRGMGLSAQDTADTGLNQVRAAYDVPAGCVPPPPPPRVSVAARTATALEAGAVPAELVFAREAAGDRSLTVLISAMGAAIAGSDYAALPPSVTIPAGAAQVVIPLVPIDDAVVEKDEMVTVMVVDGGGYTVGSPASASVTIVSDDVAPDLVIATLTAPKAADGGASIDVACVVQNTGLGAAEASSTSFHLSKNSILDAADVPLGAAAVPALGPGAESGCAATLALPVPLEPGTMYLIAKADGSAGVTEMNESNNTRAVAVAIGPDLVVSALGAPSLAGAGVPFAATETVANVGAGPAAASVTRFFLSANLALDASDLPLQSRAVPALEAGASSSGSAMLTIPEGTPPGSYYLLAQADGGGTVAEANESNNIRSSFIRVGPDLVVSALTAPTRVASGATILVSDTTRNSGAGMASGSTTAFYISSNTTLDTGDARLPGMRAVGPLAGGESTSGTTAVALPVLPAGTWYLIARADDEGAVAELQEANNTRSAAMQVGPDLNFYTLAVPSSAAVGATISISASVRNSGAAPAAASTVRFYLSSNATLDSGDTLLAAVRDVPPLASDGVQSGSTAVPLPDGMAGTFYLLVVLDADGAVPEYNEANNLAARSIRIQ